MKKVLFATTALIATTGMAAAEFSFGGFGRFGLVYDEGATQETVLDHRFRLTITGVTETDNGVKFEGRIRMEANDTGVANGAGATSTGAAGFAVSTGGFRLDVGNVSDVFDSGDVLSWGGKGVGYTSIIEQSSNFTGFNKAGFGAGAKDRQTVKGRWTGGDFTVSGSYTLNDTTSGTANSYWQIGAGYSFGDHRVGAMYGDTGNGASNAQWAIGADGAFGDFSYAVLVGDNDVAADTMWGISGAYAVSAATTISAAVSDGGAAGADTTWGLGVKHSLGGGVTLGAGLGQNSAGNTVGDAGVVFNF